MADYRGKANKLEKKSFLCVTASKGLNGPYFTRFPLLKFFLIKEMTSLMNHVRFGTVIAYTSKEPVCPRVELILKIIIILLIIFLGFIKSKPC